MKAVSVTASALFTILVAQSLGLLLLQRLRARLSWQEQYLYGFAAGSSLLSLLVFLVCATHVVWPATFVILGTGAVAMCAYRRAYVRLPETLPPLTWFYKALLIATFPAFIALYFAHALAPEASPDGSSYHLGVVQSYIDQHGFGRITTDMYANLPLGTEMLYLFAFSLGRHSAAALVHFCFLIALPLLLVAIGQRFNVPRAGVAAAVLVFLSPVFGMDGSTAYIDVALAFMVVALFGALQTWDETREAALLPLIGLFAGFAYAIKPTAFVGIAYAVGFVVYKTLRGRAPLLRTFAIVCACVALMIGPWLIKNAITVGNPFSPFLNSLFPNPYIRISAEESYRRDLQHYEGLKSRWDIPAEITFRGAFLNGLFGPAYLLAPLGLLALRWKFGRQVLLAAAVFASTYPANVGTRFLMAAAPFIAFAIALPVAQSGGMTLLLILFHAFTCWPDNVDLYANRYAWRIRGYEWDAALRRQPESEYLNQRLDGYSAAKLAEKFVPNNGAVFTVGGIAQAYCRRRVVVAYQSALGNRLGEYIAAAVTPFFQPNRWWTYSFPKQRLQKLRLVQTGSESIWSVSELRLFGPDGELRRDPSWRLRAHPNPWEVGLAFDNCPVTRWYSSEQSKPGMYVEVTLPQPVELAAVRAEATLDQTQGSARLEAEVDGRWVTLTERPTVAESIPMRALRREAVLDMKREGITHLSVQKNEYFAADIAADSQRWGLTLLGETHAARLYQLD